MKQNFIKEYNGYKIYAENCKDQYHLYAVYDKDDNFLFDCSEIEQAENIIDNLIFN